MRYGIWVLALVVVVAAAAVGVWQLTTHTDEPGGVPESAEEAPPGATPRAVAGGDSPRPPDPTHTPDLRNALPPEDTLQLLLELPRVGDVLRAVRDGDVDSLVGLVDWQSQPCGSPHGATDTCPEGVVDGTGLPMINVGWPVPFWVTAETLRAATPQLLAGEPLAVAFASRKSQAGPSSVYYLGLEGVPRSVGPSPIWGDARLLTGVFLIVDDGSDTPVSQLAVLTEGWSAIKQAYGLGIEGHDILTMSQ